MYTFFLFLRNQYQTIMRVVIQRVKWANVSVEGEMLGEIDDGLLILLGVTHDDQLADIEWLIRKIIKQRIFNDEQGKMNRSIQDVDGSILLVSQFTLYANTQKGNRPSYIRSATPDAALDLYQMFVEKLKKEFSGKIATGKFGAMMEVSLLNDGPVTIIMDSHQQDF